MRTLLRRSVSGLFLALVVLAMVPLAKPEACASIFDMAVQKQRGCCTFAGVDRFTRPGGDCCKMGALEEAEPAGVSTLADVPPTAVTRLPIARIMDRPVAQIARPRAAPPERPPDRAHRSIVLLI